MSYKSVTCSDAAVVFDVRDTEADDQDETWRIYNLFASLFR